MSKRANREHVTTANLPALSVSKKLFLKYAGDVAFVILVFAAFFFTSRFLQHRNELISLGVVSFGCLGCIVFFLNSTVRLGRELRRLLRKKTETKD